MESKKHKQLKQVALRWLQRTGCVVFATEVSFGFLGIVDVAGLKSSGDVYIVEAKTTTADLRNDGRRRKNWKLMNTRDVDFIYYIVSDDVNTSSLDDGIGILDENGRVVKKAKRRHTNKNYTTKERNAMRFAKSLSWRMYGHVIRQEKEQIEFSL